MKGPFCYLAFNLATCIDGRHSMDLSQVLSLTIKSPQCVHWSVGSHCRAYRASMYKSC